MINNILIVGLGNMGMAHLHAFERYNNKIKIYILDKKKRLEFVKNNYEYNDKFNIIYLSKVPKNLFFTFVVIATDSKNRFKVIGNILQLLNPIKEVGIPNVTKPVSLVSTIS